ncbi:MAG: YihY/virulence factor BrkB family protein [Anaerolineae bacterium]
MSLKLRLRRWQQRLNLALLFIDSNTGGWLGTLSLALRSFAAARGGQAAASLAYYGLFSLFPLVVLLITLANFFIDPAQTEASLAVALHEILPDAQGLEEFVLEGARVVYAARGQATALSLLALLWSASGMFTNLAYNIDLAWSSRRAPNALKARLSGLVIVMLVSLGLIVLLLTSATLGVVLMLPQTFLQWVGLDHSWAQAGLVRLLTLLVGVMMFYALYRWAPRSTVPRAIALVSALFTALAVQVIGFGLTWYLNSGLAQYATIYGPLTTIVVLMLWFYLTVAAILFGAHLGAALLARVRSPR